MKDSRLFSKETFLYGGLTPEDYMKIEKQRLENNFKVWSTVSVLAIVYFVALFLSTFFTVAVTRNRAVYCYMVLVTVLSYVILKLRRSVKDNTVLVVVYILMVSLYGFSIYIGAVSGTVFLAVTFPVLLVAVPLFTEDRPYRISIINAVAAITFCICAAVCEKGQTRSLDIYNGICFWLLSQFIILYTAREKMKTELLMYKTESISQEDPLTGFLNRRSFEDECKKIQEEGLKYDLIIVSMDVNGLKNVNDTLGHEAGDELICGAAECMRSCLGSCGKLYRTGGDEFMAILHVESDRFKLIFKNFEDYTGRWKGKHLENISISSGYTAKEEFSDITVEEMIRLSDKRMYDAKALYYSKKGIDRRGQRDAFDALCASYVKILKIDLFDDTYQIVSVRPETEIRERNFNKESVSQYLRDVALSGNIHPDNKDEVIEKTSINYMRRFFAEHDEPLSIFYQRMISGKYRQSIMQIIPTSDYSDEKQTAFLYVKDIGRK